MRPMYKIAVIGDRDSIYGFSAAGLEVFPVEDTAGAAELLRDLADNDYAVIFTTESLCPYIEKEMEMYRESTLPAIIPIPGVSGNNGYGMQQVKKFVVQAVGSDILFNA